MGYSEWIPKKKTTASGPSDIIDYIYAVLNSTKYRTVYHDFLQTAFPVIPYPTDGTYFKEMVDLGNKLRVLHTMQDGGKHCDISSSRRQYHKKA